MFFWLKKRDYKNFDEKLDRLHSSLHRSFLDVRTDVTHLFSSIDKIKESHGAKDKEIERAHKRIDELEMLFNEIFLSKKINMGVFGQLFGHKQTDSCLDSDNLAVQTDTKMSKIGRIGDKWTKNSTPMERTIINILLNTDMKLTYDDLSVMLGRDKSTIRGQVNSIKQKNEGLITEHPERNGRKRFYIPDVLKNDILKERNLLAKRAKLVVNRK